MERSITYVYVYIYIWDNYTISIEMFNSKLLLYQRVSKKATGEMTMYYIDANRNFERTWRYLLLGLCKAYARGS